MMRRILLPLERSDDDTGAVALARSLAQRRSSEILLLRVEEWPLGGSFGFGWAPAWRAGELGALKSSLEDREGVPTKILSPEAAPSAAILEQARLHAASLILIPYRRERSLMRVVYGHAAERVLRESPIPVLAVPTDGSPSPRISRILYPYDVGESAVPGLRQVIDFAQLFEAGVYLQRVVTPAAPEVGYLPSLLFRGKEERSCDDRNALSLEERLLWILRRREVPAEVLPPARDPSRDVLKEVARNRIDLVILAKTADSEKSCTSLARQVLQGAQIPVLVTREGSLPYPPAGAGSRLRVGI